MLRSMAEDPLAQTKAVFQALNGFDNLQGEINLVRQGGYKLLVPEPRHGAAWEYKDLMHEDVLPCLRKLTSAAGVEFNPSSVRPAPEEPRRLCALRELWREAEKLALAPNTFAVLKQVPELQQLIVYTAVPVIAAAGGLQPQFDNVQKLCRLFRLERADEVTSMQQLYCGSCPQRKLYVKGLVTSGAGLMLYLTPHMRPALAAQLAAGMLCPRQPPPPDTPEHGSVLSLFLTEGYHQLLQEIKEQRALAASTSSSSRREATSRKDAAGADKQRSKPARKHNLAKLWAHTQPAADHAQQQQQPTGSQGPTAAPTGGGDSQQLLPPPDKVRSWTLSPHIDLQLQVPSQQLLQQAAAIAATLHQQHAQQQGQQQLPDDAQQALAQAQLQELAQQLVQQQEQQQQPWSQRSVGALRQELLPDYIQSWLSMGFRPPVQQQQQHAGSSGGGSSSNSSAGGSSSSSGSSGGGSSSSSGVTSTNTSSGGSTMTSSTIDQLLLYSSQLAARCLLELTAAAVSTAEGGQQQQQLQQALPLHALQLFSASRALEEAAGQVYMAQEAAATAVGGSSGSDTNNAGLAAAQQQVVCQALTLCELLRSLRDEAAAVPVEPPVCSANSVAAARQAGSSSTSSSSGSDGALPPHRFFAGNGPLVLQTGQQQQEQEQHQDQKQRQEQQLQQVLIAAATSSSSKKTATRLLIDLGQTLPDLLGQQFHECRDMIYIRTHILCQQELLALATQLGRQHIKLREVEVAAELGLGLPLQAALCVLYLRAALWEKLGLPPYDAPTWQEIACGGLLSSKRSLAVRDNERQGHQGQRRHLSSVSDISNDSSSGSDGDYDGAEFGQHPDTEDGADDKLQQAHQARSKLQDTMREHVNQACRGSVSRVHQQRAAADVQAGTEALRHMASAAAAKLSPLQQWHSQQVQRQQEAASKAHSWSRSPARAAAAVAGATGKAAASADSDSADSDSAAGGSGSSVAQDAPHNYHPACPLCKQEQQQAHLNGATSSSSSTNSSTSNSPYSCWPVAYDAPFLWRRLLWRLLGKLSPEAQAFYATYLAMCPHCNDSSNLQGMEFGATSLEHCMWSPPDANLPDLLLAGAFSEKSRVSNKRVWTRQYSRALSSAFVDSYQPSTSLVAKQVLLALSPLHHQVLPPPETAHYLPSSFGPGIGKALMQQLLDSSTPVLDGFAHEHCRLQLWHVWWHVGLRQHQLLQQKQQHMQELSSLSKPRTASSGSNGNNSSSGGGGSATTAQPPADRVGAANSSSSSRSKDGVSSSCSSTSDDLYLDADARLFAVGVATRQLQYGPPPAPLLVGSAIEGTLMKLLEVMLTRMCTEVFGELSTMEMAAADFRRLNSEQQQQLSHVIAFTVRDKFIVPGLLPQLRGLLQHAACGPADLLVPLQQQRGTARMTNHRFLAQTVGRLGGEAYLQLGAPQLWQEDVRRGQQLHTAKKLDLKDITDAAIAEQEQEVVSEAAALMLADPVPVECLVGPEVWWAWHQSLAKLSACDVCAAEIKDRCRAMVCAGCSSAVYCSEACRAGDDGHDLICRKLVAAQQRYHAGGGSSSSTGDSSIPGLPVISSLLQPAPFELPVGDGGVNISGSAHSNSRSFVRYQRLVSEIQRALSGMD